MSKRQRKISLTTSSTTRNTLCDIVLSSNDTLFERKIGFVTEGLQPFFVSRLKELPQENALTIVDYIISMKNEINLSDNYRKLNIYTLYRMSKFFNNKKTYKEFTREDLLQYLDSFRRPEASDPLHQWIGSYNVARILIMRFFRWFPMFVYNR